MKKIIKEHKNEILFVLIIALLYSVVFLSDHIYTAHDTMFHMNRIVGSKEALQDLQLLPKVYPYTNNGYGYAAPLFYCDLFIYPFAIIHYLGIPLVISYKLALVTYNLLAIVSCFYCAKFVFKKYKIAPYAATILYMFSNYHLYDVFARSSFGEILAMVFIPIILLAIYKILVLKEDSWLMLGTGFALLVMSHLISFVLYCLLFASLIAIFVIKNYKDKKTVKKCFITITKAVGIAILLSAWYLIPMFEQFLDQDFVINHVSSIYDLKDTVLNIRTILNPIALIDNQERDIFGLISIGWPLLFVQIGYIFVEKNKIINILIIIADVLLLIVAGIIPVYIFKTFDFIQFLFRLYVIIFPLLTIVTTYVIIKFKVRTQNILIALIIIYSIFNLSIICYQSITNIESSIPNNAIRENIYDFSKEISFKDYNGLEISGAEYLPTTEINNYLTETTFIKEITESGKYIDYIYDFDRNFTKITINSNSEDKKLIMLPQTYYKGYQAYEIVDGQKRKIETISVPIFKKVGYYIEPGERVYTSEYIGTPIQYISLFVSFGTLLMLAVYKIRRNKNED